MDNLMNDLRHWRRGWLVWWVLCAALLAGGCRAAAHTIDTPPAAAGAATQTTVPAAPAATATPAAVVPTATVANAPPAAPTAVPVAPWFPHQSVPDEEKPILLRQSHFAALAEDIRTLRGTIEQLRLQNEQRLRFAPDFQAPADRPLEVILTDGALLTNEALVSGHPLAQLVKAQGAQEYPLPSDVSFGGVALYDRAANKVVAFAAFGSETACDSIRADDELIRADPATVEEACLRVDPIGNLGITGRPPAVDPETYRLKVDGAVERPLELSLQDLKSLPQTSGVKVLICPGVFVDTAEWSGVPIHYLLEKAGLKAGVIEIRFHSLDGGYQVGFPVQQMKDDGAYLATMVNGEPLPDVHGFPARLVITGVYGANWVKWIGRIEAVTEK
jgi:hypothetical protein